MVVVAIAGFVVVENAGFDFRLPVEIRAMASVTTQAGKWRVHQCMLDLAHETTYADDCVDRDRGPLLLVWGDSTAAALIPGLRAAQNKRAFGIAQFTASSCTPALDVDIAGVPNCRANNDHVLALVRQINPDIVLLHGIQDKYLDHIAETVAALKRETAARVVVLGTEPMWDRGLPGEVLRYYLLYHRLIPERTFDAVLHHWKDAQIRDALVPRGAEFISASDVLCNAEGCLTRIGGRASDMTASDAIHLTEKTSVFLVDAIIDRLLDGKTAPTAAAAH